LTVNEGAQLPVIYLAAGRGSRLGDLTAEIPKALVEVGGRPLADRSLEYLRAAGFERVIAVVGHAAEKFDDLDVEQVFNDRWDSENNITSLWQVREIVKEGCVIVNCDLLFEPELARRLANTEGTAILVDDELAVDDESMKATEIDRRPLLATILDEFIAAGNVEVYYEDALEALGRERPVRIERIGGTRWVEIDDHQDLARAENEIAPAIDALEVG
jgi:choline kinase